MKQVGDSGSTGCYCGFNEEHHEVMSGGLKDYSS